MLRVRKFHEGRLDEGDEALLAAPGLTWIDVVKPDEAVLGRLAERYGLHKLALEDCLHLDQRPKLEEYPGHQFLVLQGFTCASESLSDVTMHELHFFLGPDWLITVHEQAHAAIAEVDKRLKADPTGTLGRGVDFVAYLLADALVDWNFPLLDRVNDAIDDLEERVFLAGPAQVLMQEALELKRTLVLVRRVLSPQRDVVGLLARHGIAHVQERTTLYFRDVYDHLVRIYEQLEAARDLIGGVVDAYLSVVANRTADVSKQLTIFATLFLPLSFVVGFFGQNFEVLSGTWFFWLMLGLMVALPSSMFWWFHRKGWL
ncbi:MAG: magnesium/cobalt transporter CorA [Myxococcales bacterium]|nr:magnesium/cobalt transporter CorA [Myxococcales bacterium]